jgi:hypothetical protein
VSADGGEELDDAREGSGGTVREANDVPVVEERVGVNVGEIAVDLEQDGVDGEAEQVSSARVTLLASFARSDGEDALRGGEVELGGRRVEAAKERERGGGNLTELEKALNARDLVEGVLEVGGEDDFAGIQLEEKLGAVGHHLGATAKRAILDAAVVGVEIVAALVDDDTGCELANRVGHGDGADGALVGGEVAGLADADETSAGKGSGGVVVHAVLAKALEEALEGVEVGGVREEGLEVLIVQVGGVAANERPELAEAVGDGVKVEVGVLDDVGVGDGVASWKRRLGMESLKLVVGGAGGGGEAV